MSITFELLCLADPRMEDLRRECEEIAQWTPHDDRVAWELWYGSCAHPGIKARMVRLVGSNAEVPELAHPLAYNTAHRGLWKTLMGWDF